MNTDNLKFPLGKVLATNDVAIVMENNSEFNDFCLKALKRHSIGDWGDLNDDDIEANEEALEFKERLFSTYNIPLKFNIQDEKEIYIITEYDRSVTTILFPSNY